jgi:putative heme-binding domain-containing protein
MDLRIFRSTLSATLFLCLVVTTHGVARSAEQADFEVADGFEIQEVTTENLVSDVFCMTTDAQGRPVVSGPGYIKTLLDTNDDGIFDRAVLWTDAAQQGAQGLWSDNTGLYYVSDNALWLSRDTNGDLRADGRPTRLLSLPTGGEHDAHAIRKGPDGYWYMIAGNFAGGIATLANDPDAPVQKPRGGTLWRFSPDFQTRGVYAHGMRNSYDFDFLPDGQIVVFDSDGERDVTLPWYRPTRVMALSPGVDCGWVGESWKDPDYRVTMPRVLAKLGRGSPTGVVVYDHFRFPQRYHQAAFVLDWTFGRVMAIYPKSGEAAISDPIGAETFVQTTGQVGFAPTDIVIEPTGSLLICVGGRGTRGALYRVSAKEPLSEPPSIFETAIVSDRTSIDVAPEQLSNLKTVLSVPCPDESFSESTWVPLVNELGGTLMASAAVGIINEPQTNHPLTAQAQRAAIARLLRLRTPLSTQLIDRALASPHPTVQAIAWQAIARGRVDADEQQLEKWRSIPLDTADHSLTGGWSGVFTNPIAMAQLECFGWRRWPVQAILPTTWPISDSLENENGLRQRTLWAATRQADPAADNYLAAFGSNLIRLSPSIDATVLDQTAKRITDQTLPTHEQSILETLTLVQSSLGDRRFSLPQQTNTPNPSILDGYTALYAQTMPDNVRTGWCKWLRSVAKSAEEQGRSEIVVEATRTIAMLEPVDSESLDFILGLMSDDSHPTLDIHALCVAAKTNAPRSAENSATIARRLLSLNDKVASRELNTDNHWRQRLDQLIKALALLDANLPNAIVSDPEFGSANHLWIAEVLPDAFKESARQKIVAKLQSTPPKQWSSSLVRFASYQNVDSQLASSLRSAASEPSLRSTVIDLLARNPKPDDYQVFLEALTTSDRQSWSRAWEGLSRLPITDAKLELYSLGCYIARTQGATVEPKGETVQQRFDFAAASLGRSAPRSRSFEQSLPFLQQQLPDEQYQAIQKLRLPAGNWINTLAESATLDGQAARGELLFKQAKCAQCHGGGIALGPSLSGITRRFSSEDLFRAIYEPNRDISDRYRSIQVITKDDEVLVGLTVYNSVDGITLQTADGTLARVNQDDIAEKAPSNISLMPAGLIDDYSPQQIADLNAYLKSL